VEPTAGTTTCYRHPSREAPLRCTRCERPICLEDAVDAPVGFLCPEDAQHPARVRRAQARVAGAAGAPVTMTLVGVIGALFVLQSVFPAVTNAGLTFGPAIAAGEWWRTVTGGFLHGNLLHIGFNGYLLYQLGRMLEPGMGRARFLAVYAAGLGGGAAGVLLLSWSAPTLGASGAVFGLMGAAMVLLRRRGINPWQTQIGTLVLLNLGLTFVIPGISIGGHVGGLVGGAAAAWVLTLFERQDGRDLAAVAGLAVVLLVVAQLLGVAGPVIGALPGPF
jgi:membrane associated rhomboid family serine protease